MINQFKFPPISVAQLWQNEKLLPSDTYYLQSMPIFLSIVVVVVTFIVGIIATYWFIERNNKPSTKSTNHGYHRQTSLMSSFQADRHLLEEGFGMKQNVINAILFFDKQKNNELCSREQMRDDFVQMMSTLSAKYERMSSVPMFKSAANHSKRTCIWQPIEDVDTTIKKAVVYDSEFHHTCKDENNKKDDEGQVLKRAHTHVGQILSAHDENGHAMPLWRVVLLSSNAVLIRIDHCICDGLSAVNLLREIGSKISKDSSSYLPLSLGELSPILGAIDSAGDFHISMLPLKFLWFPNLVRAVSLAVKCLTFPCEHPNPLRPLPSDFGKPIPREYQGTVFFPTMKVALFKDMARAARHGTTINDILLLCLSVALGRYFDQIEEGSCIDGIRLVLPIANPLCPSLYGDKYHGLCNRMTPVVVPLPITRNIGTLSDTEQVSMFLDSLNEIKSYMNKVKKSNTPLLLTCMNTILKPLLSLDMLAEAGGDVFKRASCVYSNVPGPTGEISISPSTSAENQHYTIRKIQTIMPHPLSIFTLLSYDGNMFFNMVLDTRSAAHPWLLRKAFVEAVRSVAGWTSAIGSGADGALTDSGQSDWSEEIDRYETSQEWGGNEMVYTCG